MPMPVPCIFIDPANKTVLPCSLERSTLESVGRYLGFTEDRNFVEFYAQQDPFIYFHPDAARIIGRKAVHAEQCGKDHFLLVADDAPQDGIHPGFELTVGDTRMPSFMFGALLLRNDLKPPALPQCTWKDINPRDKPGWTAKMVPTGEGGVKLQIS